MNSPFSKELLLNENTSFVYYQNKEELYRMLKKHKIQYKSQLSYKLKFGIEIEYVDLSLINSLKLNSKYPRWILSDDASLKYSYGEQSGEFSSPIFYNQKEDWQEIESLCLDLKRAKARSNFLCGGHFHIDIHSLKDDVDAWLTFYQLWEIYEPILYRLMCNGHKIRSCALQYAKPIKDDINQVLKQLENNQLFNSFYDWSDLEVSPLLLELWERLADVTGEDINSPVGVSLAHWLALHSDDLYFDSGLSTLEFRLPNGTLDPIIWQNNIFIVSRLVELSLSNDPMVDNIISRYRMNNDDPYPNLAEQIEDYNQNHESLLFEFLDLICKNNEEKLDLAKQYAKKM